MISSCPKEIGGWSDDGETVVIRNVKKFEETIIPTMYKHNNFSSFVRQLNFYGFRKIKSTESTEQCWEFRHPNFVRDKPAAISLIKRAMHYAPDQTTSNNSEVQELKSQFASLSDHVARIQDQLTELTELVLESNRLQAQKMLQCSPMSCPGDSNSCGTTVIKRNPFLDERMKSGTNKRMRCDPNPFLRTCDPSKAMFPATTAFDFTSEESKDTSAGSPSSSPVSLEDERCRDEALKCVATRCSDAAAMGVAGSCRGVTQKLNHNLIAHQLLSTAKGDITSTVTGLQDCVNRLGSCIAAPAAAANSLELSDEEKGIYILENIKFCTRNSKF